MSVIDQSKNGIHQSVSVIDQSESVIHQSGTMAEVCVQLSVRAQVGTGLSVYVVGSCLQLGEWKSSKAVPLHQVIWDDDYNGEDSDWSVWECNVWLPKDSAVSFRYFIGKMVDNPSNADRLNRDLEVIVWETNIQARYVKTTNVDQMQLPLAEFGNYDGAHTTSTGWLQNHACVQLRFHDNPIYMWKAKHRQQKYSIKCSPLDYEPCLADIEMSNDSITIFSEESSMDGPPPCTKTAILYYNLNQGETTPQGQPPQGCVYNQDDYLVFLARGINQTHLGFQVDFYVHGRKAERQLVGSSHLLPSKKELSVFSKRVPIIGLNHRPIGEVQVEILHVSPLPNYDWLMDVSYQNHWKWRNMGTTLNVGHRGMGSSYKRVTITRENTIRSLHFAARHGADFVELDVMLSKDQVPVIYHDFNVKLSTPLKYQNRQGRHMVQVAIKDLTLEQLHSMKIFHSESNECDDELIEVTEAGNELGEDSTDSDDHPFPTLQSCLDRVDPQVGFNIEIKYPQLVETGESEQDNFFDINHFVDTILDVVLKHAGERKIIFSTFHADTCIMVGLKQNKYPVLFLCNGPTQRYKQYKDWRCADLHHAISFAKAEGLLGVNFQAEGLLQDLTLIPFIQSLGLVLFVWGEDLNEEPVKNTLRKLNVDAIIFDRMGQSHPDQFTINDSTPSMEAVINKAHLLPLTSNHDSSNGVHTESVTPLESSVPSTSI